MIQRRIQMQPTIRLSFLIFALSLPCSIFAQYWQQKVAYKIDVSLNTENHQIKGNEQLIYENHSPDIITRLFFHLYFNAFQPGSDMDLRSIWLPDPDGRIGKRITTLPPSDQGFLKVSKLSISGKELIIKEQGTILEVTLQEPILPGSATTLDIQFEGQVPQQIRRSGRNNKEGIAYSMAQWYPKLCQYDQDGWHPNPYIAREFYGIWGNYEVNITLDKKMVVAATGVLQNPAEISTTPPIEVKKKSKKAVKMPEQTWRFKAGNVHDFVWTADADYKVIERMSADGILLKFYYQPGPNTDSSWRALPPIMDKALSFVNKSYGKYPWPQYSFIQGGDGGMEYPMATLITGERNIGSLVGVSVHEFIHSWFQGALASDEAQYPWMDEGFTSYAESETMQYLKKSGLVSEPAPSDPQLQSNLRMIRYLDSPKNENMAINADHFNTNEAYGVDAYVKGSVFLNQLNYIVGKETFDKAMLDYFNTWKFKHPAGKDVIRVFEKNANMELDWFYTYFVHTTKKIDYSIDSVNGSDKTHIYLSRKGDFPMPVDIAVTRTDGSVTNYTIPLDIMWGVKKVDNGKQMLQLPAWHWVNMQYKMDLDINPALIKSISIDPSKRILDVQSTNQNWEVKP